jgi:hypothetical protein
MPTTSSLPSFLRKTFTSYAYSTSNPAFLNAHIVDKPHQVLITDGVGHPYSLTQYGYDETPVTGQPGLTNHDDTSYSISNNAAIVTIANASSACLAWVKTTHTYDLTGQVKSSTDPNQNTTLFSYACNNGYVETVTHPYGFVDTYSYYCPTGQVASHKDWNNQTTTYLYNDPRWRRCSDWLCRHATIFGDHYNDHRRNKRPDCKNYPLRWAWPNVPDTS